LMSSPIPLIDWHGASSSGRQRPVDKPHDDDDE